VDQVLTLVVIGVSGIFLLLAILVFLLQAAVKLLRELQDQCRNGAFEVYMQGRRCAPIAIPRLTKTMREKLEILSRESGYHFVVFETDPDPHVVSRQGQPRIISPWGETK